MPDEFVVKTFGSIDSLSFSPIVTIEPRRRLFHCTISLEIPLPQGYLASTSNLSSPTRQAAASAKSKDSKRRKSGSTSATSGASEYSVADNRQLRLLCSITDGAKKSAWEDVSGSTPLVLLPNSKCLAIETTVSARFWLVYCKSAVDVGDVAKFASELYERELTSAPFMARFFVFAKRIDLSTARIRVLCALDATGALASNENLYNNNAKSTLDLQSSRLELGANPLASNSARSLEAQEHFALIAKSRELRVFDKQQLFLECAGNLSVYSKATNLSTSTINVNNKPQQQQLSLTFNAFEDNKLEFIVKVRDISRPAEGKLAFCGESLRLLASLAPDQRDLLLGKRRRRAICALAVALPSPTVQLNQMMLSSRALNELANAPLNAPVSELSLAHIADELSASGDENKLALFAAKLGIPLDELEFIQQAASNKSISAPLALLIHWHRLSNETSRLSDLARALHATKLGSLAAELGFDRPPPRSASASRATSVAELLRELDERHSARSTDNLRGQASSSNLGVPQLRSATSTTSVASISRTSRSRNGTGAPPSRSQSARGKSAT